MVYYFHKNMEGRISWLKQNRLTLSFEDRLTLGNHYKNKEHCKAQTVTRARILLLKADGESIDAIAEKSWSEPQQCSSLPQKV